MKCDWSPDRSWKGHGDVLLSESVLSERTLSESFSRGSLTLPSEAALTRHLTSAAGAPVLRARMRAPLMRAKRSRWAGRTGQAGRSSPTLMSGGSLMGTNQAFAGWFVEAPFRVSRARASRGAPCWLGLMEWSSR
jgi:hypothetical protein